MDFSRSKLKLDILAFHLLLIHSVFSSSLKPLQARAYPADVSSEASFDVEIWEFLDDNVQPLDKRRYTGTRPVTSYTWTPAPWEAATRFHISMDNSGYSREVKRDTIAGIYFFFNGTTKDQAVVGDILGISKP